MKVSVIIPTFNEEKVIMACISSLLSQSKEAEVIIIDDGSTDTTTLKLRGAGEKVKVFEQNHKGAGEARNLGAKHANGQILVFVDADMTFDKDFIKNLVEPIEKRESKGTFSKDEFVANWDNIWARCWNINSNLPPKRRLPLNYPDHQKVFRAILKSEFDKVGGFSKGGYTDDWTLSEKLGYEAEAVEKAVFYHKNPESLEEIFKQAKWIGKRQYKLGIVGILIGLLRSSLSISLIIGFYKSIINLNLYFFVFKVIYDLGIFVGIAEMVLTGKTAK